MPANLTPQYHIAEDTFKKATTTEEKIAALEEMLAVIPKHKGTEKLQAELKKRLSKLRNEGAKKSAARKADPFNIEKQGAGQVVFFGYPNTGKSSLLNTLTRARTKVADYPFTTTLPATGMMPYEDILIQLIDLPPVSPELVPPGISGALRNADIILLVMDGGSDECLDQLQGCINFLREKRIVQENFNPPFRGVTPDRCLVLANKFDLPESKDNLKIVEELGPEGLIIMEVSALSGHNIGALKEKIFRTLDVVRAYSKIPGKAPDLNNPFVLKRGSTVLDLAESIHKDLASLFKFARVWGSAKFEGQSVPRDYPIQDKDIVEINT